VEVERRTRDAAEGCGEGRRGRQRSSLLLRRQNLKPRIPIENDQARDDIERYTQREIERLACSETQELSGL